MGVGFKVLGAGRAAGVASVKRGQGLPYARHNWFQPAPTDPPQGTAEPLSQDGGALEKAYLRKDNTQEQLCGCSAVRWGEPTAAVK